MNTIQRTSPLAMRLGRFAKAPVWRTTPDPDGGVDAELYDLRFRTLLFDRGRPFTFLFRVLPDGRVEERGRS